MKVSAHQSRLRQSGAVDAIEDIVSQIKRQVKRCEVEGVEILCCPEAVIGGLADYAGDPAEFAIDVESGQLCTTLAPLASQRMATIVGFTEIAPGNRLYNSAAVFQDGQVLGAYRKLHPAIHRSVYEAGPNHRKPGSNRPVHTYKQWPASKSVRSWDRPGSEESEHRAGDREQGIGHSGRRSGAYR